MPTIRTSFFLAHPIGARVDPIILGVEVWSPIIPCARSITFHVGKSSRRVFSFWTHLIVGAESATLALAEFDRGIPRVHTFLVCWLSIWEFKPPHVERDIPVVVVAVIPRGVPANAGLRPVSQVPVEVIAHAVAVTEAVLDAVDHRGVSIVVALRRGGATAAILAVAAGGVRGSITGRAVAAAAASIAAPVVKRIAGGRCE